QHGRQGAFDHLLLAEDDRTDRFAHLGDIGERALRLGDHFLLAARLVLDDNAHMRPISFANMPAGTAISLIARLGQVKGMIESLIPPCGLTSETTVTIS